MTVTPMMRFVMLASFLCIAVNIFAADKNDLVERIIFHVGDESTNEESSLFEEQKTFGVLPQFYTSIQVINALAELSIEAAISSENSQVPSEIFIEKVAEVTKAARTIWGSPYLRIFDGPNSVQSLESYCQLQPETIPLYKSISSSLVRDPLTLTILSSACAALSCLSIIEFTSWTSEFNHNFAVAINQTKSVEFIESLIKDPKNIGYFKFNINPAECFAVCSTKVSSCFNMSSYCYRDHKNPEYFAAIANQLYKYTTESCSRKVNKFNIDEIVKALQTMWSLNCGIFKGPDNVARVGNDNNLVLLESHRYSEYGQCPPDQGLLPMLINASLEYYDVPCAARALMPHEPWGSYYALFILAVDAAFMMMMFIGCTS
jgi:hypothetical protein